MEVKCDEGAAPISTGRMGLPRDPGSTHPRRAHQFRADRDAFTEPATGGPAARVVAQLNASFNEFTANYQQAQGAYLSSGTAADATAFKAYTDQAIGLLAQELTRTMSRVRGSLVYIKDGQQRSLHGGSSIVLQAILYSRINGPAGSGSLMATLNSTAVVPTTPPTGASATLYTLTAANAIQSARVAMINSVKLLVMNTFDNGH